MEVEIWQRLPEDLLCMILARLPMKVLRKMKTVCKEWNYLLSSRDALQKNVPNWSLHSTPGFLIQTHWHRNCKNDVECWVIERGGSEIYKLPLPHHIVLGTCNGIMSICMKGQQFRLCIGIPGTRNWRHLPLPPIPSYSFSGLTFDSSTRRCTLLLGHLHYRRIVISIYDSESSAWTQVSTMVPKSIYPIYPYGNGIYSKGKFYWICLTLNCRKLLVAFDIADGVWTEIPLPQQCTTITPQSFCEYYGQLVVVEHNLLGYVRMWKLNEAEEWCDLHSCRLAMSTPFDTVTVNSSGLIMVMDSDAEINISIYNWKGNLIVSGMRLPGVRTHQVPFLTNKLSFESNNLWWP